LLSVRFIVRGVCRGARQDRMTKIPRTFELSFELLC